MKSRAKSWGVVILGCILAVMVLFGCEVGDSTSTVNTVLAIVPATVYLDCGKVSYVQFSPSGGDGSYTNYTWSVSSNLLGTIWEAGETALYINTTNSGVNTLTVTDSSGNIGSANITQQ